ncbi:hypothetical protein [Extensimonas sp. H3M7-6]|uniref:hypothetical protein n=1 Tax=Extensimonas soli TaxID=3031322 RepID=UPI0023D9D6AB|nr:hypothetical protein [Extensimonas sp. H3M7-6]
MPWNAEHYPVAMRHLSTPARRKTIGACRTLGVDSENAPQRGQFLPDSQPHSGAMGQEDGKKWAAAAHSQPTIPKSDRLLKIANALLAEEMDEGRAIRIAIAKAKEWAAHHGLPVHDDAWDGPRDA